MTARNGNIKQESATPLKNDGPWHPRAGRWQRSRESRKSESHHKKVPFLAGLVRVPRFPNAVIMDQVYVNSKRCPIALWGKPLKGRNIIIVFLVHLLVTSGSLRNIAVVEMSQVLCTMVSSGKPLVSLPGTVSHWTTELRLLIVNTVNVSR